jgi:microcystin-dependent protein
MDKVNGNYLTQANKDFPLDCETLDYIAQNAAMIEMLGNIGGDKIILSGCEVNNSYRSAGYVFLKTKDFPNGEILRWEGGNGDNMCVQKTDIGVVADGYDYPKAYTRRTLVLGLGEESFYWKDFSTLKTNVELAKNVAELEERINNVAGEPIGVIKLWAGTGDAPDGYLYCDGTAYSKNGEYENLYKVIGDTYNDAKTWKGAEPEITGPGDFRVPDLRSRFIVGYNPNDSDYNTMGNVGGEKTHTLTIAEMPSHKHSIPTCKKTNTSSGSAIKGHDPDDGKGYYNERYSNSTGSGNAHENRPPYYALAYIIKYK